MIFVIFIDVDLSGFKVLLYPLLAGITEAKYSNITLPHLYTYPYDKPASLWPNSGVFML